MKPPRMTKYFNAATFGVLLLADATMPAWAAVGNRQEEVFQGVARDDRGEIAYTEEHRMIYENGRPQRNETRYRDAKGQEIAVLNSNFTTHPYVPSYAFEDRRFGRQDGTFVDGAWVKIYGRTDQNAPVQQDRVRLEDNMVTGQGLHVYLRDHLEQLASSDVVKQVRFLVPLEGAALFVILWLFSAKQRPVMAVSAVFLIGYGAFRSLTELVRQPDAHLGYLSLGLTMGQWLSLPMVIAGIALLWIAYRRPLNQDSDK